MASSSDFRDRGFLFCCICGSLLSFNSPSGAVCLLCSFCRPAKELEGKEITYIATAEDIRQELKLEAFVATDSAPMEEEEIKRATTTQNCPKCGHTTQEYYTKQLRSADEGQTIFYNCPKCKHKYAENT